MTKQEFEQLKPGDKVLICDHKDNHFQWNWSGKMDKWLGKVMTVKERDDSCVRMVEDQGEWIGGGWYWHPEMIEKKVAEQQTIVIKYDGDRTVTAYRGKEKGVAVCSPEDEFDLYTGADLALKRLFDKDASKAEKLRTLDKCWLAYALLRGLK